ncbi:MAG: polyphosphate polymerase domain-containing protein [Planctomycetota bacterium]|nr:MAG: polyphosphate polymerase domain-containing protein [Planctomycetota bacterium]
MVKNMANGAFQDRLMRCRYEIKYIISQSKAAAIQRFIEPYISLDRYSKLQLKGSYPIVSLYLDSDNLQLCTESLRGVLKRFKLRIRSYSDDPDYPHFFEIKRRSNTVIIKSRAKVKTQDVPALLSGQYVHPIQNYQDDINAIKQFQLYMKSVRAKPVVLVRYMRKAYEGSMENRVRLTFDHQLAYKITTEPHVVFSGNRWQHNPLTLRNVILEIKFTGRFPAWLSRMARYFELRQQSVSKYATSMKKACSLRFCAPKLPVEVF